MNAQKAAQHGSARSIVLASNTSWYLHNFRGEMMRRLVAKGWTVHAAAPDDEYRERLEALGARFVLWPFDRRSMSPLGNTLSLLRALGLYRRIRPDIVHHFTIKPVILGGIAARLAGVQAIVQSVTGLGHAFSGPAPLRAIALTLYRIALGGRVLTIFQNADDMQTILAEGATVRRRCRLIRGSGVDTKRYGEAPPPMEQERVTFLMACRMLRPKGVYEFVEAADALAAERDDCRFVLVGDADEGAPDTVERSWLEGLAGRRQLEWRGFLIDVAPEVYAADIVVLPSYYNEGLPKSLLEGAAAGRPLIAADNRGSRDIVVDGKTGRLVPPRDAAALADAMRSLLDDRDGARTMGGNARSMVEERYALDRVIAETCAAYEEALSPRWPDIPRETIRVLHIITGLLTGGAEQMLMRLIEHGDRERFTPVVVSLRDRGDVGARIATHAVPVYELGMSPGRPSLKALWRLREIVRRERPDVVQTWLYHADLMGGIAARMAGGTPVAWGIRHADPRDPSMPAASRRVAGLCARLSRALPRVIVTNSAAARRAHGDAGYDLRRMTVIPNGFDLSVYHPAPEARSWLRNDLGLPEDAILITAAGRLHPVKGHREMLDAAALMAPARREGPPVHIVMCGEGVTPGGDLAVPARQDCLAGHIHLLGRRDDLPRIFAASDIVTSPSLSEAFPQVVGEAMACGVPCVVTDVGDSADIVGETGLVVPPGDATALAGAWEQLLEEGSEGLSARGARARARIEQRYELARTIRSFEQLHADLAASNRR